jgi:nucleotide-binding universal stress UspA family protein
MYQRILVAIDGSAPATRALHEAVQLAAALHAQLRLLYVVDIKSLYAIGLAGIDVPAIEQAWCEEGRKILTEGEAAARAAGIAVDTALRETDGGRVGDAIAAEAKDWPADLIVAGTHGRHGIGHLLLGSVAEGIARGASVPVLLVRGSLPTPPA